MDTTIAKKTWPTPYQQDTDPGWTARHPRPEEGDVHAAVLPEMQRQWDEAEGRRTKTAARAAAIQVEREITLKEAQQRQEATRQARDQGKVDALTADLRRSYMAQPGSTEGGFEKALPELLEQRRRDAALAGEYRARAAQAGLYRNF